MLEKEAQDRARLVHASGEELLQLISNKNEMAAIDLIGAHTEYPEVYSYESSNVCDVPLY
jgi:hypothetical protein